MTDPVRREKQPDKSLSDIFNQFAKDSVERFPALDGKLLIYDANERAAYGRDELNLKKAGCTPEELDTFLLKRTAPAKVDGTYADWGNKVNLDFILYSERVSIKEWDRVPAKTEKDILIILDHELAHLTIKLPSMTGESKQYKETVQESIADAYALIRHYQRYGAESEHRNNIIDPWARAGALALNKDTTHFSTYMLEEIIKRKGVIDFARLSHEQTVELARRFAVEYTPPSSVVNNVVKKLKPVYKSYNESPGSNQWLKLLAEITLDPKNDYATAKLCTKILRGYLDGGPDIEGRSVRTTGAEWDNIRKSVKEAELKFAKEDILFDMPVVKKLPANQNRPGPKRYKL